MASRLQDVLLRGTAAARPLATAVAAGTLYYATDTAATSQSDGTVWASYADAGGVPGLHAPTHSAGGTDPVTVTNLAGYPGGSSNFLRADGTFATPPAAGITQLTGDVTAGPGSGSQAATLATTAVTPGSYTLASLTVDAKGRLTAAANGSASTGTVTHTAGALTLNQLVVGNASADLKVVAATDGQMPIGKTSDGTVALATLTAGAGVTITNAAGAVTIAASSALVRRQVTVILDGGGSVLTTGQKGYLSLPVAGTWKKWRVLSIDSAATAGSIVIDVWRDTYANYPPTVADTITASAKPTVSSANAAESSALTGWTTAFSAGDVLGFNIDSVATVTRVSLTLEFE